MTRTLKIAIDAMSGDNDPDAAVNATLKLAKEHPDIEFILFGDQQILATKLNNFVVPNTISISHADTVISSFDKPTVALRASKDSSMRLAIEAVKDGKADAIVSSGNTGALMAIAKIVLRTLPQIARPAIIATLPNIAGTKVALVDAGANAECSPENLFEFAIMGSAYAKVAYDISNPKLGLLNIGTEDIKGTEFIKASFAKLNDYASELNFIGYVEGNNLTDGTVDVVVTDGFTGNIALKTIEGTARFCKTVLTEAFKSSWLAKLGYLLVRPALKNAMKKLDHRHYNGAMIVGLNGIVVKSHGAADESAFISAANLTINLAKHNINDKIISQMNICHSHDEKQLVAAEI